MLAGRAGGGRLGREPVADRCLGGLRSVLALEPRQAGKAPLSRLERKHLTLRTRLKRLTFKTICFSKKQLFHDGIIILFTFHFFFGSLYN